MFKYLIALAVLCLCSVATRPVLAQAPAGEDGRRTVSAVRIPDEEQVVLDGVFDEAVWSRAVPATDFVQQDPMNGAPPTERTEVRFAFTREALYMAVTCFDSDPTGFRRNTMKRDDFLRSDDRFMWVIDPFLNGQGGYFFEMNPSGLMGDSLIGPTGPVNREWDGIWDAYTRRGDEGWTIEIRLPFRTVNFDPNASAWGVNFQRTVRRKNEESLWVGWAYNQGLFRIQNTGLLLGIRDVVKGLGLDLKPYAAYIGSASPATGETAIKGDLDVGLDVQYNVTPAVRANLTLNTDFAQTEVDQRQVNLTRYSLFFPEKRGFFLEGASFFDFASFTQRGGTAVVPFFSRRIGLDENGLPQKIDVGAKVTGQIGAHDVGFLQIRTGDDRTFRGEHFSVARVRRRVLRQSYVGAIFTRRDPSAGTIDTRTTAGIDYRLATTTFRGSQNLESTGYVLQTTNPLATGGNYAYGASLDYPNDRYFASMGFREVQRHYDAGVGFTLRNGYRRYNPILRFQPRPARSGHVRQYFFGVDGDLQFKTDGNETLMKMWDVTAFRVLFQSQDSVEAHFITTTEHLDDDFRISRDILLPRGADYDYKRVKLIAATSHGRVIAVSATVDMGEFYAGNRKSLGLSFAIRPRPGIVVYLDNELNAIDLPEGRFQTRLYRMTAETQFGPWIALTNNVQYDTVSQVMGWQSRFRWIITPGSDLYVVYNHRWLDDPIRSRFATLDRTAASKIVYTLGL